MIDNRLIKACTHLAIHFLLPLIVFLFRCYVNHVSNLEQYLLHTITVLLKTRLLVPCFAHFIHSTAVTQAPRLTPVFQPAATPAHSPYLSLGELTVRSLLSLTLENPVSFFLLFLSLKFPSNSPFRLLDYPADLLFPDSLELRLSLLEEERPETVDFFILTSTLALTLTLSSTAAAAASTD